MQSNLYRERGSQKALYNGLDSAPSGNLCHRSHCRGTTEGGATILHDHSHNHNDRGYNHNDRGYSDRG